MQATSRMPAMYPDSAGIEPYWYVATPRGVAAITVPQLEDAIWKGHVGAGTLVTRAGMPTWYTLGVLTGFDATRAPVSHREAEACVSVSGVALAPAGGAQPRASRLSLAVGGLLLVVLLGGLALGARSPQVREDLAVVASDFFTRHVSPMPERVREMLRGAVVRVESQAEGLGRRGEP